METVPRPRCLLEGVLAGWVLCVGDWAASGLLGTPWTLVLASHAAGVLGGLVAGGLAATLGRPRLAPAIVLAAGVTLEGLSVASKELVGSEQRLAGGLVALAAAALLAGGLRRGPARRALHLGALLALPAGAGLLARLGTPPWILLAGAASPLVFLGLTRLLAPVLGSPRRALGLLTAAVLVLLGAAQRGRPDVIDAPQPAAGAPAGGPSLVLLVIDTLRADAPTPTGALARFAREGVEFRQCVSAAPWTLPAVASLLTGRYPSEHGAVTPERPLAEEVRTLAEILRAQGYATGAFTGGAFVGLAHGLQRGFETFDPTCERTFTSFGGYTPLLWRVAKNRYLPQRWLMDWVDAYRGLAGVLDAARAWAEREATRPKLLFLHTYQVHDYYLYEPDLDDETLASAPPPSARFAGRLWVDPRELPAATAADLAHFEALYHGRLAALERLFPRLVDELTPLVGEDAVWIVTADHGEGFDAERRRIHHGGRLHEDLLRVPLILRAKGRLAPGRVVEDSVRSIDVLPTALELLGLPVPGDSSGESLLPALRGERPFPPFAFAEERNPAIDLVALRRGGWKWIQGPRRAELYHLDEDPGESAPVGGEPPLGLRDELSAFREHYPLQKSAAIELDAATRDHLQALGYAH